MSVNQEVMDSSLETATFGMEIVLSWDPEVSWQALDEHLGNSRDGIEVTVNLSGFDFSKDTFEGTLSTTKSADNYLAMLTYGLFGPENGLVEHVEAGHTTDSRIFPDRFEVSECRRTVTLYNDHVVNPSDLRRYFLNLEKRMFVDPRNDNVNMCDYWNGFFGTAAGIWSGSNYARATPPEHARQLAYEVGEGIRVPSEEGSRWIFPGYVLIPNDIKPKQTSVVIQMNQLLRLAPKMEPQEVVTTLGDLASLYYSAGRS